MRVAHVVRSDGFAGVEAHILALAPALARTGVTVRVIGGDPARMSEPLHASGIQHLPATSIRDVARRSLQLRDWRPQLIHTHMTAAEIGVLAAYPMLRVPLVSTRHFAEVRGPGTRWQQAYRLLDRRAAQISVSQAVADAIGTPSTVIHPGVVDHPGAAVREPTILIAQRLEAEKDTATGVEAFRRSRLADHGWRLLVAGRGADEPAVRRITARDPAIEVLGYRADVRDLMARSSIFLATSPAEHFGISVVEAMACGTPVVATARAGHLETVGVTSPETLFAPSDSEAAADLLLSLAQDEPRRRRLGAILRADYLERFTVERCAAQHLDLYQRLVA